MSAPRRRRPALDDESVLKAFTQELRLVQGQAARTVVTYEFHARAFSRYLSAQSPPRTLVEVETEDVRDFLFAEAARGLSPSTRSTELYTLKSLYRFLAEQGQITTIPTDKVKTGRPKVRTEVYSESEAEQILAWAASQKSLRWKVGTPALATFRYTGLRLSELIGLRLDDLDLQARRLLVIGKGSKPRTVPIPPVLAATLEEYLGKFRPQLTASPFVFVNPRSDLGRQYGGGWGPRPMADLVLAAGQNAGVSGRHFPHRWRHTYATSLLRRGVDIHLVQRLLGHSNIVTTTRYLHLSDADLADAIDFAFPDVTARRRRRR